MHFWAILASQKASNNPMNDPLLSRKNDKKNFFDQKWSKLAEQKFLQPENYLFGVGVAKIFLVRTKGVLKLPQKVFGDE